MTLSVQLYSSTILHQLLAENEIESDWERFELVFSQTEIAGEIFFKSLALISTTLSNPDTVLGSLYLYLLLQFKDTNYMQRLIVWKLF